MLYRCSSCTCSMHAVSLPEPAAHGLGFQCPVCRSSLVVTSSSLSASEQAVIDSYPLLIAAPFAAMHAKQDIEAKIKTLIDVLTNVLKYLALIVESEYLQSEHRDDALNRIIEDELNRPLVSSWGRMLQVALSSLETAGHDFFIPELKPFYEAVELKMPQKHKVAPPGQGYYDDFGNFVQTSNRLAWFQALVNYRNKVAHGLNQPPDEARQEFEFYYRILLQILEAMAWCARYPLYKRDGGNLYRLMGAQPRPCDTCEIPEAALHTNLVLGTPEADRFLPLVPLLVVPGEYLAESGGGEDLLIYDQSTDKRILYLSPYGHRRETTATLGMWRRLIEKKRVTLPILSRAMIDADEIARRCRRVTAQSREVLRATGKVIPNLYCSREKIESSLTSWLGNRLPLVAVAARAGSGKSCLFDHLAGKWEEAGARVLFLLSSHLTQTELLEIVREKLRLHDDVSVTDLAKCVHEERPLVIVLDGINEHAAPQALMQALVGFVRAGRSPQRIKIAVSFRSESPEWSEETCARDGLWYAPSDKKVQSPPLTRRRSAWWRLEPMSVAEARGMWREYSTREPKRFKPRFSFYAVQETSRDLSQLLRNPLAMRLFLEVYHGRPKPPSLSRHELFEQYFQSLASRTQDDGALLLTVARLCRESASTAAELDALYGDERSRATMLRNDVGSPYLRLLRLGVLREHKDEVRQVGFVYEAFFDYVLGRVLVADGLASTPEGLAQVCEEQETFANIVPACREALATMVQQKGLTFVCEYVDAANIDVDDVAGPVLGQMVLDGVDPVMIAQALAGQPTRKDLEAASGAASFLFTEQLKEEALRLLDTTLELIPSSLALDPDNACWFRSIAESYLDAERVGQALGHAQTSLRLTLERVEQDKDELADCHMRWVSR